MEGFSLISRSNNVSFFRRNNEIRIISDLDLDLERFQEVMQMISNGEFFSTMYEINRGLLKFMHQNESDSSIITLFVKNDFDEDDQELGYLCFKTVNTIGDDSANISGEMDNNDSEALDKYDEDRDAEKISFEEFSIDFTQNEIIFYLRYCEDRHPTYIGNLIGKYFEKMFIGLSNYLN